MRRRLTLSIVAVTVLTLLGLGVPLGIAVQHSYLNSAVSQLQRQATEVLSEIALPLDPAALDELRNDADAPPAAIYGSDGKRIAGAGPDEADAPVTAAMDGDSASVNNSHEVIVAVPITDRSSKTIVGVVRVTEARSVVDSHVFRAWAVMTAAAIAALLVAWAVASLLANKLARPLLRLASNAATLGDGGIVLGGPHTGINELDQLDAALTASSERLAALLARERAFSSDVSHQLRTPLTRLRLQLETLDNSEGSTAALGEVDGLQATIDHLLALSRDRLPVGEAMSVQDAVGAAATRWKARVGESRRLLQVDITPTLLPIRASRTAFDQILDVLIDNAVVHGLGTIELVARRIPGGVAVDVGNPGPAISANEHDKIFERGYGNGNGIGLALARSVAEADGGRLVLSSTAPPRFSLIYVT